MDEEGLDTYTITIDTLGQASKNTFSVYLTEPLKNVVQAELLAAHIHTDNTVDHVYVSIDELNTLYSERATQSLEGQGEISTVRSSFASLICDAEEHHGNSVQDMVVLYKQNDYPISHKYPSIIRRVNKLNIKIMEQTGNTIPNSSDNQHNFFILNFKCQNPGLILP